VESKKAESCGGIGPLPRGHRSQPMPVSVCMRRERSGLACRSSQGGREPARSCQSPSPSSCRKAALSEASARECSTQKAAKRYQMPTRIRRLFGSHRLSADRR
jgi:hypothetical protein